MPTFQLQADGKTFEVDAPDMETAAASLHAHTGEVPSMVEGVARAASPLTVQPAADSAPGTGSSSWMS